MPVFAIPGHGTPLPKSTPWSCGQRGNSYQLGYNRMSVEDLVTMTTSGSSLSLSDSDSASSESLEDNAEDMVMNSAGLLKSLLVSEVSQHSVHLLCIRGLPRSRQTWWLLQPWRVSVSMPPCVASLDLMQFYSYPFS